ncbi:SDR family oxidoreductase [Rhizobacter sp. Root1221]|uniref:SDR family NAD(P)-dependent oxidoreductase n=1 Tax=Rhizobacter sp. Root1221 TaxID=1736433 RepID=UPI0006F2893D|nr:SDR family oxidoreductase [Rhizobacter sp. Root1221]KQV99583.1 short-chain dehydrogenase [Rhizobacter sp. Root1221]
MSRKRFAGRVAAITGAGSGMGRALAVELARRGCHLALSDIDDAGLAETARIAAAGGVTLTLAHVDTANREALYAWAEQVVKNHGRVNLLFNNAGVSLSAPLADVTQADFDWIMGINFWGVVWGTQAFLPHLTASGEGHVVNTSSLFGLMSVPLHGPYNASKFAVRGYTEALRMELDVMRSCVSATCVHPGGVRTEIARRGRVDARTEAYTGQTVEAVRGMFDKLLDTTSSHAAAQRILDAVVRNERRVLVGRDAWWADKAVRLLGGAYQGLVVWAMRRARSRSAAG